MNKKTTLIILFLLVFSVFFINLISFVNGHSWGDDFAAYIDQARALVDGNFDEIISMHRYRFENSPAKSGPILTSWGLPILLAPVYYIFGLNILAMKIYINLFFVASLIIAFLLFQDRLKNSENLLLVAIMGSNPVFFDFKENIGSDIPFLFFSLFSLFLIKQFIVSKKIWINKFTSYLFLGFIIFFAVELRHIGYVLLPVLIFVQFIENNVSIKKLSSDIYNYIPYIFFFILYAVKYLVLPSISLAASTGFKGRTPGLILHLAMRHIKYYIFLPSKFFFLDLASMFSPQIEFLKGHDFELLHLSIYGIMLFFIILGIIRNMKKDYIYILYGLCIMTILILYPATQGPRYILPVFPFFLYFMIAGLSKNNFPFFTTAKLKYLNVNAAHIFGFVLLVMSLSFASKTTYHNINSNVIDGPYSADSKEVFDYIKRNTDKDTIISFAKPRAMSLYTDRKSTKSINLDQLSNSPADYIVYIKSMFWWYKFNSHYVRGNFKCIFENKTFILCDLREKQRNH